MNKLLLSLGLAILGTTAAQAVTIIQGLGADYVKFTAASVESVNLTSWSLNNNGSITALAGNGEVIYDLNFNTAGNYFLYLRVAAPNTSSDSIFVVDEFNSDPSLVTANVWNSLNQVPQQGWVILNNTAGTGVEPTSDSSSPEYNGQPAVGQTFELASPAIVDLYIRARESNLVIFDVVLSTDATLTATQLNNLAYSAVIPEPGTIALLGVVAGAALLTFRRRAAR